MSAVPKSHLPRPAREWYAGSAVVFWTHTFDQRATGWLDPAFHGCFRELLLHARARYRLACPIYVLMPDHWHLVWMGLGTNSDQWLATRFLRKHLQARLHPVQLQDRAYDHVLRERERERDALMTTAGYIRENPVRAGLTKDWTQWPHLGAVISGYPDLDPRDVTFWPDFWKIYGLLVVDSSIPAFPSRATGPAT